MAHQRVLKINRADPLAAGLYQVLAAVHQLDTTGGIDGGYIAGTKPAIVRPPFVRLRSVEVAAGNPGPADLQLAHGFTIARSAALVIADTDIDKRQGPALLGSHCVLLVFSPVQRLRWQARHGGLR